MTDGGHVEVGHKTCEGSHRRTIPVGQALRNLFESFGFLREHDFDLDRLVSNRKIRELWTYPFSKPLKNGRKQCLNIVVDLTMVFRVSRAMREEEFRGDFFFPLLL
jgi:hypothetical protein